MSAVVQFQAKTRPGMDGELWSAALEASPQGIAVAENGRVLYANRVFAELFGNSPAATLQNRKLDELVPAIHLDRKFSSTETGQRSTAPSTFSVECIATAKNGTPFPIEISLTEFHFGGRGFALVHANRPSTSRTAQRIQESQRMEALGRLVSGVAHDFNNLITGIVLYCDLLIPALAGQARLRDQAISIRKASEQGAALIQQLLAVARRQVTQPQVLSWNEIVQEMMDLLKRLIGESIELVTEFEECTGRVRMDASQMQQIILNLVINARDAMPGGGRMVIKTCNYSGASALPGGQSAPMVEFAVCDTGCGMDEHTRAHLFEPFFTTKEDGQGNGLGLFTVHSIVTQDGGAIHVESEPGKGTRVVVRMPRVKENRAPKPERKRKR